LEVILWRVEFYEDNRGRIPAYDFISSLSPQEHAAALREIDLLTRYGTSLSTPYVRHIEGSLWELRPGSIRLFYFLYTNNTFIILHGYRKKGDKAPKREIDTAMRRMREFEG
jgi:phage-related protein